MTFSEYSNKENVEVQEAGPSVRFGMLKLYFQPISFARGRKFAIDGIEASTFDTDERRDIQGLKAFNGIKKDIKSAHFLAILTLEQESKDGDTFQSIKQYRSFRSAKAEKEGKPHEWFDKASPLLEDSLIAHRLDDMISLKGDDGLSYGPGIFVMVEEIPTGKKFNDIDITMWKPVTVYKTRKEMVDARTEFYAAFEDDEQIEVSTGSVPDTYTPAQWASMIPQIKEQVKKGKSHAEVAEGLFVDIKFILPIFEVEIQPELTEDEIPF